MKTGAFPIVQKNGVTKYRSSITFRQKHISLGSFLTEEEAHRAYLDAKKILCTTTITLNFLHREEFLLPFSKLISLLNFRDHHIYIKTPIYLRSNYFEYFLSEQKVLKFDMEELFYYSTHTIMCRQGHLFVSDYGMQVTISSRYGIKPYAVEGRDYEFINGDSLDYRSINLRLYSVYHGVIPVTRNNLICYQAKIHIRGNYIVGTYDNQELAAVAYNKAVDLAHSAGITKNYPVNYLENCTSSQYANLYTDISISSRYLSYLDSIKKSS